ncbi:hypothetical protein [Alkaliphilus hydrothermalis]|uniref:DUF3899 domain-containing protein n=1 Tax=Alkaliphilus hydrothermalis TaxID=1482730 RepID=A0ABS2NN82_9FIRM|nr:hypothetical protein [Alkaliphilus hydrothermalis]MBM7614282.1 hypothetical protein [Alkaliphilus hydrothermalis]
MVDNLKDFGKAILKFLLIVASIVIVASLITLGICNYWNFEYSVAFFVAGIIFMGIGALSFMGSHNIRGDFAFRYSRTAGITTSAQNGVDDLNEVWNSWKFFIYVGSVGAVLILISTLLY